MREFRINNFDIIRIFAASQVLISHLVNYLQLERPVWWNWNPIMKFPGVPIFFVISGYLVSASLDRSHDIHAYIRNRALRIYPGLWACLLTTVLIASILGKEDFLNFETLKWLPLQMIGIIYTPSFLRDFGSGTYNGSLWTITIELQFYFVLPILLFIGQRFRKTPFLTLLFVLFLVIAIILRFTGFSAEFTTNETMIARVIRYSFLPHFYLFILGALMQNQKIFTSKYIYNRGHIWILFYLVFAYFVPKTIFNEIFHYYFSMLLLAVCTISCAYTKPKWGHDLLHGYDISYGVYIYHFVIINVIIELGKTGSWYYATLVVALSYAFGFASWIFVERYFITKKIKNQRSW